MQQVVETCEGYSGPAPKLAPRSVVWFTHSMAREGEERRRFMWLPLGARRRKSLLSLIANHSLHAVETIKVGKEL